LNAGSWKPILSAGLRLGGPLVEVVCLVLLFQGGGKGWTVAGRPIEPFLYAGFALGFLMVVAGLTVFRPTPQRPHERWRDKP
jgi:hypothetical protein